MRDYSYLGLKRTDHLPILEEDLDFRKLNMVLENSSNEVEYLPDSNGFYLRNKDLELRQTFHHLFDLEESQGSTSLWFYSIHPKINFSMSPRVSIPFDDYFLPFCTSIASHRGKNIHQFSFPLDNEELGETINIKRFYLEEIGDRSGPKEWFDKGSKILRKSFRKLHLLEHISKDYSQRTFSPTKNTQITSKTH